jgi:glycogen debranching enzyme
VNRDAEWLEADGLGGFASGTVGGLRSRRYHALLLTARTPPTGRVVLVNGFDAWLRLGGVTYALSSQLYAPDVVYPDGGERLESFLSEPWPRWTFNLDGVRVDHEILVPNGAAVTAVSWRVRQPAPAAELTVRPFLSGRDYHSLHHENAAFRFEAEGRGPWRVWRPYAELPAVAVLSNGAYSHEPIWYRNFFYRREAERGLDATEDLASPGTFRWDLQRGEAIWILAVEGQELPASSPAACMGIFRGAEERRRRALGTPLRRAGGAYLVRRGEGGTVIAGYPWFTDWGRDTFIALRGLCLATGRLEEAAAILVAWSRTVSRGMLPNRFPDAGAVPEYNSVDASLWFVAAVAALLQAAHAPLLRPAGPTDPHGPPAANSGQAAAGVGAAERRGLLAAVAAILDGYAGGTRYGIHAAADGLLAAGEPGSQLTWMDARVGDRAVTPRCGKAVEVQALWIAALAVGGTLAPRWQALHEQALASFAARFWNERAGCLYDVVDVDHQAGAVDASLRPNQILAVGGLPLTLLSPERARRVVDAVEAHLWTPLGLRTLAPGEPGYRPRYEGDPASRDAAYHQGTAWPWLLGPWRSLRRASDSSRRLWLISASTASAICRRSPTATSRTCRAAARSRPGRWASCCV